VPKASRPSRGGAADPGRDREQSGEQRGDAHAAILTARRAAETAQRSISAYARPVAAA
jgi:hypothetical protein